MPITKVNKYSQEANGKLSDLISLGQWKLGIVNTVDEYNLPNDALLDALNMDIADDGKVYRRSGYIKILDGICHSSYTFKNELYFIHDGNLKKINKNQVVTNLINDFGINTEVFYTEVNGELYISNGKFTHKINSLGNVDWWSVNSPDEKLEVVVTSPGTGSLKKGRYRINYSYLVGKYETAINIEDVIIDVPYDFFTFEVSCNPNISSTSANFYVSSTNGEELYLVTTNNRTNYSIVIDEFNTTGKMPKKFLTGIYPLDNICYRNGRIWGTIDEYIYFSASQDYRQMNPALYIKPDDTNIVIFKAVDEGLYVVTEKNTYFVKINGSPEDANNITLINLYPFSAIEGTLFENEKDNNVGWLSTEGLMIGTQSGQLENVTKDNIDLSKNFKKGSSLIKEKNGITQILFSLNDKGEKAPLQTDDYDKEVN